MHKINKDNRMEIKLDYKPNEAAEPGSLIFSADRSAFKFKYPNFSHDGVYYEIVSKQNKEDHRLITLKVGNIHDEGGSVMKLGDKLS